MPVDARKRLGFRQQPFQEIEQPLQDDHLLGPCRPRGLPIGNLTSQFWSNCYLHPFDQFVSSELGCRAYLRYVDDFAFFSDGKAELWRWKQAAIDRLRRYRLTIHDNAAQVMPTAAGVPWLGFVVFPDHRRVKARKVVSARRRLAARLRAYHRGEIGMEAIAREHRRVDQSRQLRRLLGAAPERAGRSGPTTRVEAVAPSAKKNLGRGFAAAQGPEFQRTSAQEISEQRLARDGGRQTHPKPDASTPVPGSLLSR